MYFGVAQRDLIYIHDASSSQVGGSKLVNLIKVKRGEKEERERGEKRERGIERVKHKKSK